MTGESEKNLRDTGEKVIAKMNFFTYKVVLDKPSDEVGVILDKHEFNEYKWFETSELKEIKLSPPSVELFESLGLI